MGEKPVVEGSLAKKQQPQVIVIEADKELLPKKLRVAAYARVSSDSTDQLNSVMAQVRYYSTYITSKEEWILRRPLMPTKGSTGTSAEKRTEFQRLIADCKRGLIDKVLCKSISRFARNTTDCLETIRLLKGLGVGVCFEEQNIDTAQMSGELLTAIFAAISQKESESISQNTQWGNQRRMANGTYCSPTLPYGYRREGKAWVIEPREAEIVRGIFHEYLSGGNLAEIAARLNWENVPNKLGKHRSGASALSPTSSPTSGILGIPAGKRLIRSDPSRPKVSGITGSGKNTMCGIHTRLLWNGNSLNRSRH